MLLSTFPHHDHCCYQFLKHALGTIALRLQTFSVFPVTSVKIKNQVLSLWLTSLPIHRPHRKPPGRALPLVLTEPDLLQAVHSLCRCCSFCLSSCRGDFLLLSSQLICYPSTESIFECPLGGTHPSTILPDFLMGTHCSKIIVLIYTRPTQLSCFRF